MKQFYTALTAVAVAFAQVASAQNVSQNFESQAEINALKSSCWTLNNISFEGTAPLNGNGSIVTQTGTTSGEVITPELEMPSSGNLTISFSYKQIASTGGVNKIQILLLNGTTETRLDEIVVNTNSLTPYTGTFTKNVNGFKKVIIRTTPNLSAALDDLAVSAPYVYPGGCSSTSEITLPVKFTFFDAKSVQGGVAINWTVGMEDNVSGYAVEKSTDEKNFSTISLVSSVGLGTYSFIDPQPSAIAYYRIKSVEFDGKSNYSAIVSVKSGQSTIVLRAFPTPVRKDLTIQHNAATVSTRISISSIDGRLIQTIMPLIGSQQTTVDLSSARAGLYIVRFESGTGDVQTLKVMKQ